MAKTNSTAQSTPLVRTVRPEDVASALDEIETVAQDAAQLFAEIQRTDGLPALIDAGSRRGIELMNQVIRLLDEIEGTHQPAPRRAAR